MKLEAELKLVSSNLILLIVSTYVRTRGYARACECCAYVLICVFEHFEPFANQTTGYVIKDVRHFGLLRVYPHVISFR